MHQHHRESIQNTINYFKDRPEVKGLLLGGSIAHGFESADSDIDVMILISDQLFEEKLKTGSLVFVNKDLCNYKGGYADGKYISAGYMKQVAEKGSEPARFAFQDARILFSDESSLEILLKNIVKYPVEGKSERIRKFYAQLEAWHWFITEATRLKNSYLLCISLSKLVLFGGRMILTYNELFYPFHKWFIKVLESAKEKPSALMSMIERLYKDPSVNNAEEFHVMIKEFTDWGALPEGWPSQFLKDTELSWQTGKIPVDDL